MKKTRTDLERFHASYEVKPSGCWDWKLSTDSDGYGQFSVGSQQFGTAKKAKPHRFAYEEFVGPIPAGLTIDHLCRNRCCVNPDHLEPVTIAVNVRRSSNTCKSHCTRGHEMNAANIYVQPSTGHRSCKECRSFLMLRYRDKIGREAVNTYQREWDKMNRRRKRDTATS